MLSNAVGIAAAVIALISLYFTHRQVQEATRQTRLQREIAESAGQPYVWVDIRSNQAQGWLLELVLGNSGPTVATNVRATFDPPLPDPEPDRHYTAAATTKLANGLSSLAPGRELVWTLGGSVGLVNTAVPDGHTVRIEAQGPFGPLEPLEYVVNLNDFRETVDSPPGSMHQIRQAIDRLETRLHRGLKVTGGDQSP